ncbi:hypothetical protein F1C58_14675 [Glaciihabitans sp. INWT7]|uniref:hypothetical protein n=1 Tax=Glaciihabitans sp. INWT7 TaxID=2596912 RepID=UPI0016299E87|nr:hypothetical protein [Glaciihabitans sp. INWT7]QNE48020.1 hypothetical protein F1C58_14675 [Glaciihabitans sp. INWT7]
MTQPPEITSRAARVTAAARSAAAAFGPNYRRARQESRWLRVIGFTRVIAFLSILGGILFTGYTVLADFLEPSVSLSLPVYEFWPTLPPGAAITSGPSAHVTGGGFTSAQVQVSGLDGAARTWLAGSALLQGATVVMIAIVVLTLCSTLLRSDPFHTAVTRGIRVLGITVIVGGLGWQLCSGVGESLASTQVLQLGSAEFQNVVTWESITSIIGFPSPTPHVQVDFWPIWVGLAMLVLAAAFRYGERLQRDTAGLV